jgi:protein-S-isoprenylcysteine O-methyltransferase Ste14
VLLVSSELVFRIVFTASFLITIAIMLPFRLKSQREGGQAGDHLDRRKEGPLLLLRIPGLVLWLVILAYIINPDWVAWAQFALPDWARWAAAGVAAIANPPFAYWTMSSIGKNITDTVDIRTEHQLVTHGPYRWVRHPFYTLGFSIIVAYGTLAANWLMLGLGALAILYLVLRLPTEEAMLIEKFGDQYRSYMQHTGRFLPRLR